VPTLSTPWSRQFEKVPLDGATVGFGIPQQKVKRGLATYRFGNEGSPLRGLVAAPDQRSVLVRVGVAVGLLALVVGEHLALARGAHAPVLSQPGVDALRVVGCPHKHLSHTLLQQQHFCSPAATPLCPVYTGAESLDLPTQD